MVTVYNRKNQEYINEKQYQEKLLKFLYNTILGRCLLKIIINPCFSTIYGKYKKSNCSKKGINKFIEKNNININEYEYQEYNSFNDFFIRKKKEEEIKIDTNKNSLISPCDGKLMVYEINQMNSVDIKGTDYYLSELLKDDIVGRYRNGYCIVIRLSVDNYHRYCFIDDCEVLKTKKIKGKLHTICSISKNHKIYKENKREWTQIQTKNFGEIIQMEVGALFVGDIMNHKMKKARRGEEKGYFNIGGSTIVLFLNNNIKIDQDILKHSIKGIECLVKYGDKIGELKC